MTCPTSYREDLEPARLASPGTPLSILSAVPGAGWVFIRGCWCCSAAQSCPALCDPGFPVLHYLLEFVQIHAHWVGDANYLMLCRSVLLLPSVFPCITVFSNKSAVCIRWPSIKASASATILPMNIQGWFPLGLTGLFSLQSKGLSRVFSSTTVRKHQFFSESLTDTDL